MSRLKGVPPRLYYLIGGIVSLFCVTALLLVSIKSATAETKSCTITVPKIAENGGFPGIVLTSAEKKRCCELAAAFHQNTVSFDGEVLSCQKEYSIVSPMIPLANALSDIKDVLYKILINSRNSAAQLSRIEERLEKLETILGKEQ